MLSARLFGLYLVVVGLVGCGDSSLDVYLKNRQGIGAVKAQNLSGAREKFVEAMAISPFEPELHLNLGVVDGALGRFDAAVGGFKNAERYAKGPEHQLAARFNLGEVHGKAKKIDEALSWYQKTLEIDPTSIETKTNIELLVSGAGQDQQKQQGKSGDQNKDKKDQQGDDQKDQKDGQDDKDKKDQQKKEKYADTPKYKPREFKGDLSEGDVKKILGEIRQQEKKIRAEFNRREAKEKPRDKDW